MPRSRFKVSLTDAEAAVLQAHPDYSGSLGDLVRVLALRAAGLTPSDPYAAHKSRARDEKGKMMPDFIATPQKFGTWLVEVSDLEGFEKLMGGKVGWQVAGPGVVQMAPLAFPRLQAKARVKIAGFGER